MILNIIVIWLLFNALIFVVRMPVCRHCRVLVRLAHRESLAVCS